MALATASAFENLRAFVLGDHSLHLQEQLVFGRLPEAVVEKDDIDARTLELVEQEDLIGVLAGQAIGRLDVEAVHSSHGGEVTQALQSRAHEGGPTVVHHQ